MAARGRLGIDLRDYRRRLVAFRDEVERLWSTPAAADDRRAPDGSAIEDAGTAMETLQLEALAIEADRRSVELRQIEAALQRMADGRYGYCLTCGENIAPDRLEGDPTAVLCNDCARLAGTPAPAGQ